MGETAFSLSVDIGPEAAQDAANIADAFDLGIYDMLPPWFAEKNCAIVDADRQDDSKVAAVFGVWLKRNGFSGWAHDRYDAKDGKFMADGAGGGLRLFAWIVSEVMAHYGIRQKFEFGGDGHTYVVGPGYVRRAV